ncbi:MAG TPA: AI-2E family transporter [Bacillota bacterium]
MKKPASYEIIILIALLFPLIFFFLFRIILPFFLGLFLALLLEPLVVWFERKGAPRTAAVLTIFVLLGIFLTALVVWFLPGLITDLDNALAKLPDYARGVQHWFARLNQAYKRFRLPQNIRQVIDETLLWGEEFLRGFLLRLGTLLISFFPQSILLLLTPVLAFYFSRDLPELRRVIQYWAKQLFQEDQDVVADMVEVVIMYLRAQAVAGLVVGLLLTTGLLILRVDLAILIGVLAGVFNIIPYFGPLVGATPAVLLAVQDSPWKALYVVLLFFLVNQLETAVIIPRIIGDKVGLHPLLVIFFLLVGGELFGFAGVIFAVPVGAVFQVMLRYYWRKFTTEHFGG